MKTSHQITVDRYISGDGFIGKYQKLIKKEVIPYQYEVLNDRAEGAEKSHVIMNFVNAGKAVRGEDTGDGFYGMVFQDSDAAKWIEAAAYSLVNFKDAELEKCVDSVIDYIAAAQDTDGYLNTYYTIKDKDKRWTNLTEGHELYCAGHMMEAACAYYEATGKKKLLDVMEKNAEHIYKHFIMEKNAGCPGHPEVELALMKVYRLTGNGHCLELAEHFIDERGKDPGFFEKECKNRSWSVWGGNGKDTDYMQASAPVREQKDAMGHAVRAVYLYTGMADIAGETGDETLLDACRALWDSIVNKRMYVTGGIGSTGMGEAFTVDYDLPSDNAYCETCASIGLMFFAGRMLEHDVDRRYSDVMERAFYNTVLAGMQLDGKSFFYVNPLECTPGITGKAVTQRHVLPIRPRWYACACCPPNTARLISSFGKYAYAENSDTAFCHIFAEGKVKFGNGMEIVCETDYPYGFTVNYKVTAGSGRLAIRIPGWSRTYSVTLNGKKIDDIRLNKGYAYIEVHDGDSVSLELSEETFYVYGSNRVPELSGKAAVERGPLVYCFEGVDNENDVFGIRLKERAEIKPSVIKEGPLKGIVALEVASEKRADTEMLYSVEKPEYKAFTARAIPYYAWCNRGENRMRVWMPVE